MERNRENRIQKKSKEKELISLWRKKMKLFDAKRNLNLVELDKPIRSGYKKFFILREDFSRSDDANVYLGILPYIQKTIYCRNENFLSKEFKTKKMIEMNHNLSSIDHKKWNQISDKLTEKQRGLFQIYWQQSPNNPNPKVGHWAYRLVKQYMFVPKIEPHYKTHSIILNPDLESEIKEIENKIEKNNLMPKLMKSLGWSNGRYYDYYGSRRNKLIENLYDDEANVILEYDQFYKNEIDK